MSESEDLGYTGENAYEPKTPGGFQVTNTSARLIMFGHKRIIPGDSVMISNDFREAFDGTKKRPSLAKAAGLVEGKATMPAPRPKQTLGDMTEAKAIAQVNACSDLGQLAEWDSEEGRPAVKAAILARGKAVQ